MANTVTKHPSTLVFILFGRALERRSNLRCVCIGTIVLVKFGVEHSGGIDILISLFAGAFRAGRMLRSVLIPKLAIEMTFHGCGKSLSPLQSFQYIPRQLLLGLVLTAALTRFPSLDS